MEKVYVATVSDYSGIDVYNHEVVAITTERKIAETMVRDHFEDNYAKYYKSDLSYPKPVMDGEWYSENGYEESYWFKYEIEEQNVIEKYSRPIPCENCGKTIGYVDVNGQTDFWDHNWQVTDCCQSEICGDCVDENGRCKKCGGVASE